MHRIMRRGTVLFIVAAILGVAAVAGFGTAAAAPPAQSVVYDNFQAPGGYTLSDYGSKWSNPYGLGDMGAPPSDTRSFADGSFYIDDAPFRTSADFSVFDHLKYIAISNQSFTVPQKGSLTFSSQIAAQTPGTQAGRVIHGTYGPPGSYPNGSPYSATVFEGQQAGAVMNMVNFATGQLFDWFISGNRGFTLVERLPSSVTGNTTDPNSPEWVGPNTMYTQIVNEFPVTPGVAHTVAITYSRGTGTGDSTVEFFLDGKRMSKVKNVGIPLDRQTDVTWTGTYPSLGPGAALKDKLNSFVIGHGTFSLLDAFPFQWGWTFPPGGGPPVCDPLWPAVCALSVSIPASERLFGQGVRAHFDNFTVTTRNG
jgi:hypothetical protein